MGAFIARYDGTCVSCGGKITANETMIRYGRKSGKGRVWHADCTYVPPSQAPGVPEAQEPSLSEPSNGEAQEIDKGLDALRQLLGTGGATQSAINKMVEEALGSKTTDLEDKISRGIERANSFVKTNVLEAVTAELDNRLPRQLTVTNERGESHTIEGTHHQFDELFKAVQAGFNVYLWGSPGGGKSHACHQLAEALGLRFAYLSLTPQYPESRIMGYKDATGTYQQTLFYDFYTNGGVFLIDEMDNASAALLTALNSCLSNGLGTFPCGMVNRHKDFIMVATGNTTGKASPQFPDRRPFDMAFLDRFYFIRWEYDMALESRVVESLNPSTQSKAWLGWVRKVREWSADNAPRLIVSPRAAYSGATMLRVDEKIDLGRLADSVLFRGSVDRDTRDKVLHANPLPRRDF